PRGLGAQRRRRSAVTLSRRLPWLRPENPLARLEAEHRAEGRPLWDLTVTNPTAVGLEYPTEALARTLGDPQVATYPPGPRGGARARGAGRAGRARRGALGDRGAIALTASSSESYSVLFKLLGDPGAVVLVPEPSYPLFDSLARLEGLCPRPYRLYYDG